jgi:hypothetical protein
MIPDCVQWRLMANRFGWWRDVAATSEALELTFLGHAGRDRQSLAPASTPQRSADRTQRCSHHDRFIGGLRFKAHPVQHSIRAPAVGYRVSTKGRSFFYLPDVAKLQNVRRVLRGIGLYIGDGATMRRRWCG